MSTLDAKPIIDLIRKEARKAAEDALREAHDKVLSIREESDRRADDQMEETLRQAHAEGERLAERMLRMAGMEQRRAVLASRLGLIREALHTALERLRALPAEQVAGVMLEMLKANARGDERLMPGSLNRAFYTPDFIGRANAALRDAGKPGSLADSGEEVPGVCGIVLRGEGSQTHCTFEALVESRREDLEALAASVLFPGGEG
ncbi:MAG TPA: hypothetical protein VLA21_06630 [Candidatus Limnocylindria bacterium]|nr:hypothetical protein [Candidatus Limnocylindria bacterium]